MISAILACKIREVTQYLCLTESAAPLRRSLNNADAQRERKMCARWDNKTLRSCGSTSESQKRNKVWANPKDLSLGAFLKRGGGSIKRSAKSLSWQHCASPFLQLRARPRVKQKMHAALIKLVPLKFICVNALLKR